VPGDNDTVVRAPDQTGARTWQHLVRAAVRAPVSGRTWREVLYCLIGLPLGLASFMAIAMIFAAGTALTLSVVGAVLGLALLVLGLALARGAGFAFRRLARRLLGLHLPEPPKPAAGTGVLGRLETRLRDGGGWRAVAYLVVRLPLSYGGTLLIGLLWGTGLYYLTYPLWWYVVTKQVNGPSHYSAAASSVLTPFAAGGTHITTLGGAFGVALLGIPLLLVAPWIGRGVVLADCWLLRLTSGSSGRVRELEASRALAVDDAAATLRRVERDLHDGAQARLVALALTLGMAREKLGEEGAVADPERLRTLVDAAHASAKIAVTELRDLARGIHPPVLDNGLPDALATLATQSAVPTDTFIDLSGRPTPSIEAIAYFCTAELVANVGKHSGAARATIEATEDKDQLRLRVFDNGHGGATATPGGGLAGLADRVRTVDGSVDIDSPPGGPTVVLVRLPMHA
jgi:signal transduction histidine kinase